LSFLEDDLQFKETSEALYLIEVNSGLPNQEKMSFISDDSLNFKGFLENLFEPIRIIGRRKNIMGLFWARFIRSFVIYQLPLRGGEATELETASLGSKKSVLLKNAPLILTNLLGYLPDSGWVWQKSFYFDIRCH